MYFPTQINGNFDLSVFEWCFTFDGFENTIYNFREFSILEFGKVTSCTEDNRKNKREIMKDRRTDPECERKQTDRNYEIKIENRKKERKKVINTNLNVRGFFRKNARGPIVCPQIRDENF